MSTAQDHKELASLQDVFGKGAGSSFSQYRGGVATTRTLGAAGPQGSGGSQGSVGSPIANVISTVTDLVAGKKGGKAATLGTNVLANPNATLEELIDAREATRKAQGTLKSAKKLGEFTGGAQTLGSVGEVMHGNLGNASSLTQAGIQSAVPYLGPINAIGNAISEKYNPFNKALQYIGGAVEKIPGVQEYVDPAIASLGDFIADIPGTETGGTIAKHISEIPDKFIKAPLTIYESLKNSKADEASARDEALTKMFTEEVNGELYISRPTENLEEVVSGIDLPGAVNAANVGKYNSRYNFPYDEKKTRQELFEEFQNSDTYKGLVGEKRGRLTLAKQAEEEAAAAKLRKIAISELADPVVNIQPIKYHAEEGMGTHYSDEYGIWDVETGEKYDAPSLYDPAPDYPILEPQQYESPILEPQQYESPAVDPYQAPKQAAPVEIAPMARSDGSHSYDGGISWTQGQNPMPRYRVAPEEVAAPANNYGNTFLGKAAPSYQQWLRNQANTQGGGSGGGTYISRPSPSQGVPARKHLPELSTSRNTIYG